MDSVSELAPNGLSPLEKLPSLGKEALVGRIADLTRKEGELMDSFPLDLTEVKASVSKLSKEGRAAFVYDRAIGRIRRDTSFLKVYDELGLTQVIDSGFQVKAPGLPTRWDRKLPQGLAEAHVYHRKTVVSSPKPDKVAILESLAETGRLSDAAEYYVHGRTHEFDEPRGIKAFIFKGNVYFELSEAHACRTGGASTDLYSTKEIVELMTTAESEDLGKMYPFDAEIFGYCVDAIDELHALGVKEAEIANLVRNPGRWDDNEGMFVNVQKKIDEVAQSHDLDEDRLSTLVEVYRKQVSVERLKVMHIVQSELKNVAVPYAA